MKLLLNSIDNAPLDTLLTYFKVQRRDEQPERDWTMYFSPWHKDKKRVLRVSNGHRKGGLYASPLWEENRKLAQLVNNVQGNDGQIKKGHIPWNKGLKLKDVI